jgi:hypothetical protein
MTTTHNNNRTVLGLSQNTVFTEEDVTSADPHFITFAEDSEEGNQTLETASGLTYTPSTDTLSVGHITGVASQVQVTVDDDNFTYRLTGTPDDPSSGTIDTTLYADNQLTYKIQAPSNISQLAVRSVDAQMCLFKSLLVDPNDYGYKLRYLTSTDQFTIVRTVSGVDTVIMTIDNTDKTIFSGDVYIDSDMTIAAGSITSTSGIIDFLYVNSQVISNHQIHKKALTM